MMMGTLFPPKEALNIGLVDELASDKADAMARCASQLEKMAKIDRRAYHMSKMRLRQDVVDKARAKARTNTEEFYRSG